MPTRISSILPLYQKHKRAAGLSEDTIDRVMLNTTMFTRDMKILDLKDITTDSVITWGETKLANGVSHSTIYTYYNSIRSFLQFSATIGLSHEVDLSMVHCRPRYKRKRILTPSQIRRVIKFADPQTAVLIRLLFTAGLRISEALSLDESFLKDGTVIYIIGKGSKSRPVVVTGDLLYQLRLLSLHNRGDCFIDENGERLTRKKAYYQIKKAVTKAGYPWATPHTLRHSYCTDLLVRGADLSLVSKMMGHKSVAVTQIYTHLVTDDIVKAHRLLSVV